MLHTAAFRSCHFFRDDFDHHRGDSCILQYQRLDIRLDQYSHVDIGLYYVRVDDWWRSNSGN